MLTRDLCGLASLDLTYLSPITSLSRAESHEEAADAENKTEKQVDKSESAFEQLVLPPGHKEMVLSLIAQHFRDKESVTADTEQVDIVRGKGMHRTCTWNPPLGRGANQH